MKQGSSVKRRQLFKQRRCWAESASRRITEKQQEMLFWISEVVTTAIELQKALHFPSRSWKTASDFKGHHELAFRARYRRGPREGPRGIMPMLSAEAAAVAWVHDAFAHCKIKGAQKSQSQSLRLRASFRNELFCFRFQPPSGR